MKLMEKIARFVLDLVAEPGKPEESAPGKFREPEDLPAGRIAPPVDPQSLRRIARQLDHLADRLAGTESLKPLLDRSWSGLTIEEMDGFRHVIEDLRKASAEKAAREATGQEPTGTVGCLGAEACDRLAGESAPGSCQLCLSKDRFPTSGNRR
jgi:hypothetical protein